ncbi:MAG: AEC family transporter [Lawsonella sp.]
MLAVFQGFGIIGVVILVGYLLARTGALSEENAQGLNNFCFWIATPALLFDTMVKSDLKAVFSAHLTVAVVANLSATLIFVVMARLWLKRSAPELVIGGLAAGYVNSANLGIPIALYVIHDSTAFVPILLFQTILLCPVALSILDQLVLQQQKEPLWKRLIQPLKNPMVVFGFAGLFAALAQWTPPTVIGQPLHLLGQAAVPAGLVGFGHSLFGVNLLQKGVSPRRDVGLAVLLKVVVMPLIAWMFGNFVLNLDPQMLFGVTVFAALPTAVNVYIFATRYNTARYLARDANMISTLLSMPAILLISFLLLPA